MPPEASLFDWYDLVALIGGTLLVYCIWNSAEDYKAKIPALEVEHAKLTSELSTAKSSLDRVRAETRAECKRCERETEGAKFLSNQFLKRY
jgi:hypothetical protein